MSCNQLLPCCGLKSCEGVFQQIQMHKIDLFYSWILHGVSEVGVFSHNPTPRTQRLRALFALSAG